MGEARPSLGNTQMIVMIFEREWSNGRGRKEKKKKGGGGGGNLPKTWLQQILYNDGRGNMGGDGRVYNGRATLN